MADQESIPERKQKFPHVAVSGMAESFGTLPSGLSSLSGPGTTPIRKRDATALPRHRRFVRDSRPSPEALLLSPHSQSSESQHCRPCSAPRNHPRRRNPFRL